MSSNSSSSSATMPPSALASSSNSSRQTPFWNGLRSETDTQEESGPRREAQHAANAADHRQTVMDDGCDPHDSWVDFSTAASSFREAGVNGGSGSSRGGERRPRQPLSFAPQVRVHITIGRWELTASEHHETWLSADDTKRSQDDILETVRAMRKCHPSDGDEALPEGLTSRGVEHMRTRESIAERRYNKLEVVDAVLEEQTRQRIDGYDNPIVVAEASMLVSKKCRTKAEIKGASDAACARVYHRVSIVRQKAGRQVNKAGISRQRHVSALPKPELKSAPSERTIETVSTTASSSGCSTTSNPFEWSNGIQVSQEQEDDQEKASQQQAGEQTEDSGLLLGWNHQETNHEEASGDSASSMDDAKAESGAMFTNISHRKLREKLLSRVSGLALGA